MCAQRQGLVTKKTIGNIKDLTTNNVSRIDGCVLVPDDMGERIKREMAKQVELKIELSFLETVIH